MKTRTPIFYWIYFLSLVPHALEIPMWITAIAVLLGLLAMGDHRNFVAELPGWVIQALGAFSLVAIYLEYRTLIGPDAASGLLIILAGLKLHEVKTHRDAMVFLFVSTLVVMYWLLFSQTLLTTVYMIGMSIFIAVAYIAINTPRNELSQVLKASPKLVTKDLLWSLPIFLIGFFMFPRFQAPWASLFNQEKQAVGFSDQLNPGELAQLTRSEEPAFRVQFNSLRPPLNELYFRGVVLTSTDGFRWQKKVRPGRVVPRADRNSSFDYTILLEPKFDKYIFVLDRTSQIKWSNDVTRLPIVENDGDVYSLYTPILARISYDGLLDYDAKPTTENPDPRVYLRIDGNEDSAQIKALVETLKGDSIDSTVTNTLRFFQDGKFTYSLSTPKINSLEEFLFKKKIGFCEHYASAFAVFMRLMQIPSRVVIGFQGGEFNEFDDSLLVRDQNAHAWVEVFHEGKGWRRVDPTSAVSSTRIQQGRVDESLTGGLSRKNLVGLAIARTAMMWDAINNRYTQFLMSYDSETQSELFNLNLRDKKNLWYLLGFAICSVILTFFLIRLLRFKGGRKADPVVVAYQKTLDALRTKGVAVNENHTPKQVAKRCQELKLPLSQELNEFVNEYMRLRYGPFDSLETKDKVTQTFCHQASNLQKQLSALRHLE